VFLFLLVFTGFNELVLSSILALISFFCFIELSFSIDLVSVFSSLLSKVVEVQEVEEEDEEVDTEVVVVFMVDFRLITFDFEVVLGMEIELLLKLKIKNKSLLI